MFKMLFKVLKVNYPKYISCAILGFVFALIVESLAKTDHIVISSILLPFAHFCGCLYVDTKQAIYDDTNIEIKSACAMDLLSILLAIILLTIIVLEILFKYDYAILRILIPFIITILVEKIFKFFHLK